MSPLHFNLTDRGTSPAPRKFKLDFIAEEDVGTLDFNRFFLAIYFDGNFEKKLQSSNDHTRHCPGSAQTVSPLAGVWRQSLLCYIHGVRPVGKRPALQTLLSIVYRMADLQCPENANMSLTQHSSTNLKNEIHITNVTLVHIIMYYYVFQHIMITVRRRSK